MAVVDESTRADDGNRYIACVSPRIVGQGLLEVVSKNSGREVVEAAGSGSHLHVQRVRTHLDIVTLSLCSMLKRL